MRWALLMILLVAACRNTSVRRTTGTTPLLIRSRKALPGCASPKLHPAKKLNRRLDILTVKSRLDRPTRASWKAMKTQADGFLARHNPVYVLDSTADRNFGEEQPRKTEFGHPGSGLIRGCS